MAIALRETTEAEVARRVLLRCVWAPSHLLVKQENGKRAMTDATWRVAAESVSQVFVSRADDGVVFVHDNALILLHELELRLTWGWTGVSRLGGWAVWFLEVEVGVGWQ